MEEEEMKKKKKKPRLGRYPMGPTMMTHTGMEISFLLSGGGLCIVWGKQS